MKGTHWIYITCSGHLEIKAAEYSPGSVLAFAFSICFVSRECKEIYLPLNFTFSLFRLATVRILPQFNLHAIYIYVVHP